jgi:hypothetical protein
MNLRVTPPGTAKGRRAWLYLSLLLPSLASEVAQPPPPASFRQDAPPDRPRNGRTRPYLLSIGPLQLRFQDAAPPPEMPARPPSGSAAKAQSLETATASTGSQDVSLRRPAPTAEQAAAAEARREESHPATPASPPAPPILPIPPDDASRKVHPEDFLPYFQFPGADTQTSDSSAPSAQAAPKTIPPSTATYQEQ